MSSQKPPKNREITPAEYWQMYDNDEFIPGEYNSADHILMAKRKSDGKAIWAEYRN